MSNSLIFTVAIPPSVNNCFLQVKGRGRILTNEARAYKENTKRHIFAAAVIAKWRYQKGQRLAVEVRVFFKDKRPRDLGNLDKLLIDSIADACGFNDCCIDDERFIRAEIDKLNPRCEVTLSVISDTAKGLLL